MGCDQLLDAASADQGIIESDQDAISRWETSLGLPDEPETTPFELLLFGLSVVATVLAIGCSVALMTICAVVTWDSEMRPFGSYVPSDQLNSWVIRLSIGAFIFLIVSVLLDGIVECLEGERP